MIIGLPHGPTKFRSTLIKPYFIDDQQPVPDNPTPIQVRQAKVACAKIAPAETPQTDVTPADIPPIEPAAKLPPTPLALLDPVK